VPRRAGPHRAAPGVTYRTATCRDVPGRTVPHRACRACRACRDVPDAPCRMRRAGCAGPGVPGRNNGDFQLHPRGTPYAVVSLYFFMADKDFPRNFYTMRAIYRAMIRRTTTQHISNLAAPQRGPVLPSRAQWRGAEPSRLPTAVPLPSHPRTRRVPYLDSSFPAEHSGGERSLLVRQPSRQRCTEPTLTILAVGNPA
jgi:hypothetical protein